MADEDTGERQAATHVTDNRKSLGVALSGGGHRATLWGLGALLYLVDAGKGPDIACVSSVSGGSLANAWVGLRVGLHSVTPAELRKEARPVAVAAATGGTVWAAPLTFAYLALVAVILVAAIALSFPLEGWTLATTWIAALLAVGWPAQQRAWVSAKAFDRVLFKGALLADLRAGVDHVICSCDVQSAEQVYFSGRFRLLVSTRLGQSRNAGSLQGRTGVSLSARRLLACVATYCTSRIQGWRPDRREAPTTDRWWRLRQHGHGVAVERGGPEQALANLHARASVA